MASVMEVATTEEPMQSNETGNTVAFSGSPPLPIDEEESSATENRFFETHSIEISPSSSKLQSPRSKLETKHVKLNATVQQALNLLYQLKETVEQIPIEETQISSKFTKIQNNESSGSSIPISEESKVTEIERLQKQNDEIQKDLRNKQQQILQLATQYEEASDLLHEKKRECLQLQASLQQSVNVLPVENFSMSSSAPHNSLSMLPSSSTEYTTFPDYPPLSLPAVRTSEEDFQQEIRNLHNKAKTYIATIKQLTDMNAQWQEYNNEKERMAQRLEESVKAQQTEVEHLQQQTASTSNDPSSVTFSPSQQAYIDNTYQRLRIEADRYRDQQDTITQEAERAIAEAKAKEKEAAKSITGLQKRITELENRARTHAAQQEELQAALLVATRSSQQSSREKELISSLREAVRQYESDCKKVTADYHRTMRENNILRGELASLRQRGNLQQTIVNQHPTGTTTLTRSGRNFTITNQPARNSSGGDIEVD